jgi:cation diffusion facilitator family transporter
MHTGQRVAVVGMAVSGLLAAIKITAGLAGHSTAVVADGLESASDVFASGFVALGLTVAARPPDSDHPYGHGRAEILTGLLIGMVLMATGAMISFNAIVKLGQPKEAVASFVVWPLLGSGLVKSGLAAFKFHYGKKLNSVALSSDAWNDLMDVLSAAMALVAVSLALYDPPRFFDADRYGGFLVGLIVVTTGIRVVRETGLQLMDTMPDGAKLAEIRAVALSVEGVRGVEKCYARKTGLQYHVDLHLEVDPEMTVRQSHFIAHQAQVTIRERLDWVAGVLVHVEPAP